MIIVQTDSKAYGIMFTFLLCSAEESVDSSPVTKLHLCGPVTAFHTLVLVFLGSAFPFLVSSGYGLRKRLTIT